MSAKARELTYVELLAVILCFLIIAAGAVLFHRYGRPRRYEPNCASNLRMIGQGFYLYAQDDPGIFPALGNPRTENGGKMSLFDPKYRAVEPPNDAIPSPTRDLYAIMRATWTIPPSFVCPESTDTPDLTPDPNAYYDFASPNNLSYAYQFQHDPDRPPIGPSDAPNFPVMADGNPFFRGRLGAAPQGEGFKPDDLYQSGENIRPNHIYNGRLAQNVLFVDGHVSFERSPACGISGLSGKPGAQLTPGRDNIYTSYKPGASALVDPGDEVPTPTYCNPGGASDAVLVP